MGYSAVNEHHAHAAARVAGCSYRQLDYWCRCGVLGPQHAQSVGSGGRRVFTGREVTLLRLCSLLSDLNAGVEVMRSAVEAVADLDAWDGLLVVEGDPSVARLLDRGEGIPTASIVINLSHLAHLAN